VNILLVSKACICWIPLNQLNYYIFAFGEVDILGNDGGGGAPGQGGTWQ